MSYSTLISVEELAENIENTAWITFDCRFDLGDPAAGQKDYSNAHIPGALYAHLNLDLSGPVVPGVTGRHPLPDIELFSQTLSRWGVDIDVQVVAYDGSGGIFASRLWWMMRWLGHEKVSVLDGGWQEWCNKELPTTSEIFPPNPLHFIPRTRKQLEAGIEDVLSSLSDDSIILLDARSLDRFNGNNETIDSKAGHIPGAMSAPFMDNLDVNGCFLAPHLLETRYRNLLKDKNAEDVIVYCGSGVTATHDILAMEHSGLKGSSLYAGSWSHWITDDSRPIADDHSKP